jgi:hypothetical protein
MLKQGAWRSFRELMFRGAVGLICCAIVALCVGGLLSALAENLESKSSTNGAGRTHCKTIDCLLKGARPRLAHSEKRTLQ